MSRRTSANRSRAWFDQGWEAFCAAAPGAAALVPFEPFYVCPLCLHAFSETHMEEGALSVEDVPPERLGGRPIVLTCRKCNSTSGHNADADARREANIFEFADGASQELKVLLKTSTGSLQARLNQDAAAIRITGVPEATPPLEHGRLVEEMDAAARETANPGFGMTIAFEPFSRQRARTSWLRSAYLAFFAALGYRFILRPELEAVRRAITSPDQLLIERFRIIAPRPAGPAFALDPQT